MLQIILLKHIPTCYLTVWLIDNITKPLLKKATSRIVKSLKVNIYVIYHPDQARTPYREGLIKYS